MNEHINSVLTEFLDTETKFHYLNYYYQMMIDETEDDDEEYLYKLECLYEWWEQEEPLLNYNPDDEEYTVSEWFND